MYGRGKTRDFDGGCVGEVGKLERDLIIYMPRCANLPEEEENIPDAISIERGPTTLYASVAGERGFAASSEDSQGSPLVAMESAGSVAAAFLTNLSGGAACYDVDVGLIQADALTDELNEALGSMRRLMSFADGFPTGWTMTETHEAVAPNVVVVVATATSGRGDDISTEKQEFALHVDLTSASKPITKVTFEARQKLESTAIGPWNAQYRTL